MRISTVVSWSIYGTVVGVLSAILVLYGLQPRATYPQWMLVAFDHPWILLLIAICGIYMLMIDDTILGTLLLLIAACLYVDGVTFARRPVYQHPVTYEETTNETHAPPLAKIESAIYPLFFGTKAPQPGEPAPFV